MQVALQNISLKECVKFAEADEHNCQYCIFEWKFS